MEPKGAQFGNLIINDSIYCVFSGFQFILLEPWFTYEAGEFINTSYHHVVLLKDTYESSLVTTGLLPHTAHPSVDF